jgi:hypothetical protein
MKYELIGPKHESISGWTRTCSVDGTLYSVVVSRGKSVRIRYKPRGQNRGWQWHGSVYANGRCLWSGRIPGSLGARGILIEAGILS